MKYGWIVLLFAACMVRLNTPFRLPPPDPDGEPPPERAAPPEGPPGREVRGARRSARVEQYDQNHGLHLNSYWNLHRELARAQEEEAAHHDDEAAGWYHSVVYIADELLTSLAQHPDPTSTYSTDSDGVIDEPTLIAKTRELRARAQQLGDAAQQRHRTALFAEFHPRTEEQRKVLLDHGRPEVLHRGGSLCWLYLEQGVRETYCWNRSGQLADHRHVNEAAIEFKRIGYRLAAFASGSCRYSDCAKDGWTATLSDGSTLETSCRYSNCAKDGWTTTLPDGSTSETSCRYSNCLKDGWTTTLPDGATLETSCRYSNCAKDGWTTTLPGGVTSETSCRYSDCLKDGWTTTLPNGRQVSCTCRYSNCLKDGAECR